MPQNSQFLSTIGMLLLLGVGFYFLLWRPSQKKVKEQQSKMASLDIGSRVMLTSGIFGTVRHLGDQQMIIEIAPGLEVTVLKQALMRIVDPADDEFEYEDEHAVSEPTDEQLAQLLQSDTDPGEPGDYEAPTDDPEADSNPNR